MKKNCILIMSFMLILFAGCSKDNLNDEQKQNQNVEVPEIKPTSRVVSEEQVHAFANKAFGAIQEKESPQTRSTAPTNSAKIEPILNNEGEPVMYVVNFGDDEGFMLLSADKESANTILAFNITGRLDLNEMNSDSPMGLMIAEQKEKISKDIDEGVNEDVESYEMWESLGKEDFGEDIEIEVIVGGQASKTKGTHKGSWELTPIGPWSAVENCTWGQERGYNADAPRPNYHLAGCPAVAIGILCKVWSYPKDRGYEYFSMPNSLPNTTQSNPISRMLRNIANTIPGYNWGATASGANESNILTGLRRLGYNSAKSGAYNFNTVYGNIDDWYPVLLGGFQSNGGHIWIADGYSEIKWKYKRKIFGITVKTWYEYSDHIYMNWGWYGTSNAWIDQESWPSYSNNRRMWYDLFPR